MIAPITHLYPPPGYGPWERVTHDLTERLVEDGHDVTLFAAAGSATKATLVPTSDDVLSALPAARHRAVEDRHIAMAMAAASEAAFDVVHSHLHVHALGYADLIPCPLLTTLHGAAWDPSNHAQLRAHANSPFVSLSDREREFLPELNYVATIPNGIRIEDFPPKGGEGGYVLFVGRIAPEKAPHLAVEAARAADLPLLMAGVVEDIHRGYAESVLSGVGDGVEYLGALHRDQLAPLLGEALALIMPLAWDEPFGLVVVEALASGTPVVAWRRGAMPEIVDDGVTGFLVDDVATAAASLRRIGNLSRQSCADDARRRFSDAVMATAYEELYERLASAPSPSPR